MVQVSDGSGMSEVPTATRTVVASTEAVLALMAGGMNARVEV